MKVQVLGAGCKKCNLLYQSLQSFVEKHNLNAEVEYTDDLDKLILTLTVSPDFHLF